MPEGLRKFAAVPLYVLGFIVLGLMSGYVTFKILSFSKTVDVPDLRGKTLFEANDLLTAKSLYLKVEGEDYDSEVAPGMITRQDIPPGNKVKEKRGIKVYLSKGPRVWSVPEMTGRSLEEAEQLLGKGGLRIAKIIRAHSQTVGKGIIIAQRPTPDESTGILPSLKPQDSGSYRGISLIVSAGAYDGVYSCPDFSGLLKDEAVRIAQELNIILDIAGSGMRITGQKPKQGSLIKSGDSVHIQTEGG